MMARLTAHLPAAQRQESIDHYQQTLGPGIRSRIGFFQSIVTRVQAGTLFRLSSSPPAPTGQAWQAMEQSVQHASEAAARAAATQTAVQWSNEEREKTLEEEIGRVIRPRGRPENLEELLRAGLSDQDPEYKRIKDQKWALHAHKVGPRR